MQTAVPAVLVRTARIDYTEAWRLQRELAAARFAGVIPDVLWLLEHPPVYTIGRHGTRADLFLSDEQAAIMGASVHHVDRGGQMTWHGPGQTTAYVILNLRPNRRIREVVDHLLGAMADTCVQAGVPGARAEHATVGVYRDGRKLGSVGIRVQRGITTHGIGLNRDPDLEWFAMMTACGAPGVLASSIAAEGGNPSQTEVDSTLAAALMDRLGVVASEITLGELCRLAGIAAPLATADAG